MLPPPYRLRLRFVPSRPFMMLGSTEITIGAEHAPPEAVDVQPEPATPESHAIAEMRMPFTISPKRPSVRMYRGSRRSG